MKQNKSKGFTLIEILIAIAIISLLSSIIVAVTTTTRKKARDSQRIQNARQIATALEQYEHTNNTYKIANAGLSANPGTGYVAKSGGSYSANSIISTLKSSGLYNSSTLIDPVYGTDNYYIGLCTSTNAYNIFVKLEQSEYNQATSSIANTCGGTEAANLGFNYIGATTGGTTGGLAVDAIGSYEVGMGPSGGGASCGSSVIGPDGLTYGVVLAEDGKCWLDRNLGATQVATAYNDSLSYGHYYQWGRNGDGHQVSNSATTSALSAATTTSNGLFITNSAGVRDWKNPQFPNTASENDWPSVNNPCPSGFHVPTRNEWTDWVNSSPSISTCSSLCSEEMYNSILKVPTAARRSSGNGTIISPTNGFYWASDTITTGASTLDFGSSWIAPDSSYVRAEGFSVRCIQN